VAVNMIAEIKQMPEIAVPALIDALSNTDSAVVTYAIAALGHFGTNAAPALPLLRSILTNADAGDRTLASEAIEQIAAQDATEPLKRSK